MFIIVTYECPCHQYEIHKLDMLKYKFHELGIGFGKSRPHNGLEFSHGLSCMTRFSQMLTGPDMCSGAAPICRQFGGSLRDEECVFYPRMPQCLTGLRPCLGRTCGPSLDTELLITLRYIWKWRNACYFGNLNYIPEDTRCFLMA